MKKVYRHEINSEYWDRRWSEAGVDADSFEDLDIYPIRYAEKVVLDRDAKILEVGCGLGRVLKHYKNQGFDIHGVERSHVAVEKLWHELPREVVIQGDALDLPYGDSSFDTALAFGVYHNLEEGIQKGVKELARILKKDGSFCISMRPNNLEMYLNEIYWKLANRMAQNGDKSFHKVLVNEKEFEQLLRREGLHVEKICRARNVSTLYRIPIFRANQPLKNESDRRSKGYKLNKIGNKMDKILRQFFPYHSANVLVFIGKKL